MSIRDRSRWTDRVGSKSLLQVPNNHIERAHIFSIIRAFKHIAPMLGRHASAAHFIQQVNGRSVQIIYIFFLSHVVN
jgi:hypothetical protein